MTGAAEAAAKLTPAERAGVRTRIIEFSSGESLMVTIPGRMLSLSPEDREFVFDLIEWVKAYAAAREARDSP